MIKKVERYAKNLLATSKCALLPFHDIAHTKEVVANVKRIARKEKVDNENLEVLIIAAWFHDVGFSEIYEGHEEISKKIAKEFLIKECYDVEKIEKVLDFIEATKMPQQPKNALAKILCDADIYHISNANFFYRKLLLRKEWEAHFGRKTEDFEWHRLNLEFLQHHHFHSNYGQKVLEKGKERNIKKVKQIMAHF